MSGSAGQETRIMVLGGGRWQLPLVKTVRALGFYTLVTDISADAPARAEANEFIQVDTNDRAALLELARRFRPALVIADQTDRLVPVVAYLNEELGLPGIAPDVAERFTNKFLMREALSGSGLPLPAYELVESIEDACSFAAAIGYPLVIKPTSAQASLGVFRVDDESSLRTRLAESRSFSADGRVLIEEFIEGPEVTVEGISIDGKCSVLAISEKSHYEHNSCVAYRLAYPPRFDDELLQSISETGRRVVETLGLVTGISHAEYRLRDGKPYLIEVAARGGGNGISSTIVPHVSGVHPYQILLEALGGGHPVVPPSLSRSAVLEFFQFAPGRVREIRGFTELKDSGLAESLELFFEAGDHLEPAENDRTRPGYFIVLGTDRDETDNKAQKVLDTVRVVYA